jgi:MiaB/RimO family radical SAM methylthiotransferase
MKTFATTTLGCKVNHYETQQIRQLLERLGLRQVALSAAPELVVINTCCVTHIASAKSRQAIRKAQKLTPHATIIAAGCLATGPAEEHRNLANSIILAGHDRNVATLLAEIVQTTRNPQDRLPQSTLHNAIKPNNAPKINAKNGPPPPPGRQPSPPLSGPAAALNRTSDVNAENATTQPAPPPSSSGQSEVPYNESKTNAEASSTVPLRPATSTHPLCCAGILNNVAGDNAENNPLSPAHSERPVFLPGQTMTSSNLCKIGTENALPEGLELEPLTYFSSQSRAFLKIQDGCDGACSYCLIPKIRTRVHSKPPAVVVREAKALVAAGHREIVLTGVFLGAYGQQTVRRQRWEGKGNRLAELVGEVAEIAGLARLRLSSLEPGDVTDELLSMFSKYKNLAPHLHLPLQSGSDAILRRMRRQYRVRDFAQAVAAIRDTIEEPAITTDIIVGFPGESEADFQQTVELAERIRFAKMHIFSFSARPGTAAVRMQPLIPAKVVKRRSQVLRELDERLQVEFRRQFIGERLGVIVERLGPVRGKCERYFEVEVAGAEGVKKGHLVFGTLGENFCKCLCEKKLAAKRR